MKLFLVHGRSQGGKDPKQIQAEWLGALDKGLAAAGLNMPAGVDVVFPYYGDVLDRLVAQFDLPVSGQVAAKGGVMDTEYAEFRAQLAEELRANAGISDAEVRAEAGPEATAEKGPLNWKWVQAILRLIDRGTPEVSEFTIEKFLRDVYLYTRRAAVQRAIDNVVSGLLSAEPTVMVAHSLGTVVAYNVLRNAGVTLDVPLLVTVGSPLGLRAIRSNLGPLKNPSGKKGWYNAFDTRDVVSLYPLDRVNFDVNPSITNYDKILNWTDNRHGIAGYLNNVEVAKAIHSCLV